MFCKHCGNQLGESVRFCPKCGKSTEVSLLPNSDNTLNKSNNLFPKIIIWGLVLMVIPNIIALLALGSAEGDASVGDFIVRIINIFLALVGLASVVGIFVGVVFGVIFLKKSGEQEAMRSHYNKLAIYSFLTPFIFMVAVILDFVIVRVISNIRQ